MTSRSATRLRDHVPSRARLQAIMVACLAVFVAGALALSAQDKKGPELRTVHGVAVDKDGRPIAECVVYLMNMKTQAVRTYITDSSGNYHFSGLDPNFDYEARAEKDDQASGAHTISSFDSRRDIDLTLKLDRKRPAH